jgi:hypothetical protein
VEEAESGKVNGLTKDPLSRSLRPNQERPLAKWVLIKFYLLSDRNQHPDWTYKSGFAPPPAAGLRLARLAGHLGPEAEPMWRISERDGNGATPRTRRAVQLHHHTPTNKQTTSQHGDMHAPTESFDASTTMLQHATSGMESYSCHGVGNACPPRSRTQ